MERPTPIGSPPAAGALRRGFTLIEILIVVSIIGILVSIAIPIYQKSLIRTKESVLRNNLFSIRTQIDEYTYNMQKAPQQLQDLVTEGYLRTVPVDPMTGTNDKWVTVMEDSMKSVSQTEPGIFDVHSSSDQKSLEGTPYAEW
jgi:general secretion pathway protein G